MVCVQCSLDAAAFEVIEYCLHKDFIEDSEFGRKPTSGYYIAPLHEDVKRFKVTCDKVRQRENMKLRHFEQLKNYCNKLPCSSGQFNQIDDAKMTSVAEEIRLNDCRKGLFEMRQNSKVYVLILI